jgi:hypothetical protein
MAYTPDELKAILAGHNEWVKARLAERRAGFGYDDDGKRGVAMEIYMAVPIKKRRRLPMFYVTLEDGLAEIVDLIETEPPKVVKPPEPVKPPKAEAPPVKAPDVPTTPKVSNFNRLVTWDTCRDVVTMFEQGMSQTKISKMLKIGHDTSKFIIYGSLFSKIKNLGPILRQLPRVKEYNFEDYLCVKVARKQGASYWDIVTTLGVTAGACDWYLRLDPAQVASLKAETVFSEPPAPTIIEAPKEPPAGKLRALCGRLLRFLRGQSRRG